MLDGDLVGWCCRELGIGSSLFGKARHTEHLVADLEGGHAGAQHLDGSGNIPAENERRLAKQWIEAAAHCAVDWVDARCLDANQHLARLGRGIGLFGNEQDVGPTDGVLDNGTH